MVEEQADFLVEAFPCSYNILVDSTSALAYLISIAAIFPLFLFFWCPKTKTYRRSPSVVLQLSHVHLHRGSTTFPLTHSKTGPKRIHKL